MPDPEESEGATLDRDYIAAAETLALRVRTATVATPEEWVAWAEALALKVLVLASKLKEIR